MSHWNILRALSSDIPVFDEICKRSLWFINTCLSHSNDIALWSSFHKGYLHKFKCCYNKCVKLFFGCRKYDSVTQALFETRVPSFETVLHNARCVFRSKWTSCCNGVVYSLCKIKIS